MILEHFAGFDGTEPAVRRHGEGHSVVLLHGPFFSGHMNWIEWGHRERLSETGFEAAMLDCRVHGESAVPHDPHRE